MKYVSNIDVNSVGLLKMEAKPIVKVDRGSVTVNWEEPKENGGLNESIFYDVECYSCKKDVCSEKYLAANYRPGQFNLAQTSVVVSNLQSGANYSLRVYAKNSLNSEENKNQWNFTETEPFQVESSGKTL